MRMYCNTFDYLGLVNITVVCSFSSDHPPTNSVHIYRSMRLALVGLAENPAP